VDSARDQHFSEDQFDGVADPLDEHDSALRSSSHEQASLRGSSTCDRTCEFQGQSASCRSRILFVAQTSNKPDACAAAHRVVQRQCWTCARCTLADMECAGPGDSAHGSAISGQEALVNFIDDREATHSESLLAPSTLSDSTDCDHLCVYEGDAATCKDRVTYVAKKLFSEDEDPCISALQLVLRQCPSCTKCTLGGADCLA